MGAFCTPIPKIFSETLIVTSYCLKFLFSRICSYWIKGAFVKIILTSGELGMVSVHHTVFWIQTAFSCLFPGEYLSWNISSGESWFFLAPWSTLVGSYRQIHFWADCQILLFFHQYLDRLCHCLAGSISSPRSIIYSSAYRCFIKIYWLLAVEHCFFLSFWGNLLVDAQHRMRVLIDFIGWECRYELFVVTVPSYAYFFYKMPKKIVHSYQVSIYDASFIAAFFNFHCETKVVLFESLAVPCPCRKCGLFFPLCLCC